MGILMMSSPFALAANSVSPAKALVDDGIKLMNTGKTEEAILKFNKALIVDNKYVNAYLMLGSIYLSKEKYNQALSVYNAAIDIEPSNFIHYLMRANIYMKIMQTEESEKNANLAIQDFIKAFGVQDNVSDKYIIHSLVFHSLSSNDKKSEYWNRSLDYINRAINLNKKNDKAYNLRGIIKLDQEDFESNEEFQNKQMIFLTAISDFSTAIQCNPRYDDAYYNRGNVYLKLDEYDKAIDDFTNAIKYEKDSKSDTYGKRAFCYEKNGEHKLAITDYTKAIEKDEKNKVFYNNRGVIYAKMNEYDLALKDFQQALKIDAEYETAQKNIDILQNHEIKDKSFITVQTTGTRFDWERTEKNKK